MKRYQLKGSYNLYEKEVCIVNYIPHD